jgi:large subunit ribosomal protein L6
MSRVGKKPVELVNGVKAVFNKSLLEMEGPIGKLQIQIPSDVQLVMEDHRIAVSVKDSKDKKLRAFHGLYRALIQNMVVGVAQGYEKRLEINGVGFRAKLEGKDLLLTLGYSHPIRYPLPSGITAKVENKDTLIILNGADKQVIGNAAAMIRNYYPPEPYKGKGVKYVNEVIRRKKGKRVA